jgi:hypothetical protein
MGVFQAFSDGGAFMEREAKNSGSHEGKKADEW